MTLQVLIDANDQVNGGPGIGVMTSAGNPWSLPDAFAQELVNRGWAKPYNWAQPVADLSAAEISLFRASVSGAGIGWRDNYAVTPHCRSYVGDSITAYATTMPWHVREVLTLGGKASYGIGSGGGGYTSGEVLTLLQGSIAAFQSVGTTHVGILAGRNDIGQSKSISYFLANCLTMAKLCLDSGMTPEFYEITPSSIDTTTKSTTVKFNLALADFCRKYGFHLVRWYSSLVDTTTGGWQSAYQLDTTHPSAAGHLAMGDAAAADLSARLSLATPVRLATDNVGWAAAGFTNGLFLTTTGSVPNQTPSGYGFRYGSGYSSAVAAGGVGNRWTITQTTDNAGWEARMGGVTVSAGDIVEYTFRYGISSFGATGSIDISAALQGSFSTIIGALLFGNRGDTPVGGYVVSRRIVIPAGISIVDMFVAPSNMKTGTAVWLEQVSIVNLTTQGLLA